MIKNCMPIPPLCLCLFLFGCVTYHTGDKCCCPHPADCSVGVIPVKIPQTLDMEKVEKPIIPENKQQEHHMDQGDHS